MKKYKKNLDVLKFDFDFHLKIKSIPIEERKQLIVAIKNGFEKVSVGEKIISNYDKYYNIYLNLLDKLQELFRNHDGEKFVDAVHFYKINSIYKTANIESAVIILLTNSLKDNFIN